jgi:hypothetical protein
MRSEVAVSSRQEMGSLRRAERRPATHLSAAVRVGEANRGDR